MAGVSDSNSPQNPILDYHLHFQIHPNPNVVDFDHHHQVSDSDSGFAELIHPDLELRLGSHVCTSSQSARKGTGFNDNDLGVVTFGSLFDSDSDSDSDDGLLSLSDSDDRIDGLGLVTDFDRPPFCWDYLGFNTPINNTPTLGFEDQNQESDIELSSVVSAGDHDDDDDDYGVDLVFSQCCDGYNDYDCEEEDDNGIDIDNPIQLESDVGVVDVQEISNLFDMYQERGDQEIMTLTHSDDPNAVEEDYGVLEAIRNLEWEIMLALHNFRTEMQNMDLNDDDAAYESIIREMEDRMNEWRGISRPTANSFIDNLPTVCLAAESLEGKEACCAICKDDVSVEETLKQLPCLHYYHGDCIVPWLKMHNTCPLCRRQLPTEDIEYESRFTINGDGDVGVPPGYAFDTFL